MMQRRYTVGSAEVSKSGELSSVHNYGLAEHVPRPDPERTRGGHAMTVEVAIDDHFLECLAMLGNSYDFVQPTLKMLVDSRPGQLHGVG
jgi:hypothetical protein